MRRLLAVVLMSALTLIAADCNTTITEGTITDKNYYMPSTKPLVPARYEVCFTKDNQSRCEFVAKKIYDETKVGEWFVLP